MRTVAFFVSLFSAVSATVWNRFAPREEGIRWVPCSSQPEDTSIACGFFEVPLDYHDSTKGKARLAVSKKIAENSPKLGTLFVNPGGPGNSGVQLLQDPTSVSFLTSRSGGQYDIVSWDPRGVGQTIPGPITCFDSQEDYDQFWNDTIAGTPLQVRGSFSYQPDLDHLYSQVDTFQHKLDDFGKRCLESETGQYLSYVGTAAAVRDLLALSDYLDGPNSAVNFWGFSYGTTIGNWLVNMFPERVGRIVFDGVQEPMTYSSRPSHLSWGREVASAESAYRDFAGSCAQAGPAGCAIATSDSTAESIIRWTWDLINGAYNHSMTTGDEGLSSADVRSLIYNGLYAPATWADFANTTLLSLSRQLSQAGDNPVIRGDFEFDQPCETSAPNFIQLAITCGDAIDQADVTTKEVFDELVRVVRDVSPMFGAQFPFPQHYCHRWPVRAVERYPGPWKAAPENPVLIIGNKNDPVTPFANAKEVAGFLGDNSFLVEQLGSGHTSFAQNSSCTERIVSDYLINGNVPAGHGIACPIDTDSITPVQAPASPSLSFISQRLQSRSDSDEELEDRILDLTQYKDNLLIVVILLSCLCAIMLVALLVSWWRHRDYVPSKPATATATPDAGSAA